MLRPERVIAILLLAASFPAHAVAGGAQAGAPGELASLINAYRSAPGSCGGEPALPVEPLRLHAALAKVRIAPASFLEQALEHAGYPAERAEAMYVSGAPDAQAAMAIIQQKYCRTLLSADYASVGVARNGNDWQVVLAQPLLPPNLPGLDEAGQAILQAVNAARAMPRTCGSKPFPPAPPLAWNAALAAAALEHSSDMATRRYFSHRGKHGSVVGDRAHNAGYGWKSIGENIASGQRSAQEAVAGWLDSPGHCANIMSQAFTDMGAAYAINTRTVAGRVYWTQVLARPR